MPFADDLYPRPGLSLLPHEAAGGVVGFEKALLAAKLSFRRAEPVGDAEQTGGT